MWLENKAKQNQSFMHQTTLHIFIVFTSVTNIGDPSNGFICPNAFIFFPVIALSLINITFPYTLHFPLLLIEVRFCKQIRYIPIMD